MEELEQEPSVQFVKGFNVGYQMQQHEPELLDKIIKSDNGDNEYIQAMKLGKRQQLKEMLIDEQKQVSNKLNRKNRPKI